MNNLSFKEVVRNATIGPNPLDIKDVKEKGVVKGLAGIGPGVYGFLGGTVISFISPLVPKVITYAAQYLPQVSGVMSKAKWIGETLGQVSPWYKAGPILFVAASSRDIANHYFEKFAQFIEEKYDMKQWYENHWYVKQTRDFVVYSAAGLTTFGLTAVIALYACQWKLWSAAVAASIVPAAHLFYKGVEQGTELAKFSKYKLDHNASIPGSKACTLQLELDEQTKNVKEKQDVVTRREKEVDDLTDKLNGKHVVEKIEDGITTPAVNILGIVEQINAKAEDLKANNLPAYKLYLAFMKNDATEQEKTSFNNSTDAGVIAMKALLDQTNETEQAISDARAYHRGETVDLRKATKAKEAAEKAFNDFNNVKYK